LIGWSRLLEGRWRDPLVGGNLLAGVAIGIGVSLVAALGPTNPNADVSLPVYAGSSVVWLAAMVRLGIDSSLMLTLLWLLFRIPTRRNWLASMLFVVIMVAVFLPGSASGTRVRYLILAMLVAIYALVIERLGVLSTVAFSFTCFCAFSGGAPWTTSVSAWYASSSMLAIAALLALAIYGFRTTLAGRPLWRDELQKDAA
jgi:hypothetical protein